MIYNIDWLAAQGVLAKTFTFSTINNNKNTEKVKTNKNKFDLSLEADQIYKWQGIHQTKPKVVKLTDHNG